MYLTSMYRVYVQSQAEAARHKAGCCGVTMEGCSTPRLHRRHVAGEQGQARRGEGLWSGGGRPCSSPGDASLVSGGEPLFSRVGGDDPAGTRLSAGSTL